MQSSKYSCPKLENFGKKRLEALFTKVSRRRYNDKEIFKDTHTPISIFDKNNQKILETEIINLFSPFTGNRVFTIEGETGTGKSELCMAIAIALEEKEKHVLLINKEDNLIAVMDQLMDFYFKIIGKKMKFDANFSRLKKEINNIPDDLTNRICSSYFIDLDRKDVKLEKEKKDYVTEHVLSKFHSFRSSQKGEKIEVESQEFVFFTKEEIKEKFERLNLLNRKTINELKKQDIYKNKSDEEIIAETQNRELWKHLTQLYDSPRIGEVLKDFANEEEFQNSRPVIIFEDFSIVGMDLNVFLRHLEDDNPSLVCDFVLAGVTNTIAPIYEISTRIERFNRFIMKPEKETKLMPFLDKENCYDFSEKFMKYIYKKEGIVCKECGRCTEEIQVTFPFNKIFLENIFNQLDELDKKPRIYIDKMRMTLISFMDDSKIPCFHSEIYRMPSEPLFILPTYIPDNDLRKLATWYGCEPSKGKIVTVDTSILHSFGFTDIAYEIDDGKYIFPLTIQETSVDSESADLPEISSSKVEIQLFFEEEFEKLKSKISSIQINPNKDDPEMRGLKDNILRSIGTLMSDELNLLNPIFTSMIKIKLGSNQSPIVSDENHITKFNYYYNLKEVPLEFLFKFSEYSFYKNYNQKRIGDSYKQYVTDAIFRSQNDCLNDPTFQMIVYFWQKQVESYFENIMFNKRNTKYQIKLEHILIWAVSSLVILYKPYTNIQSSEIIKDIFYSPKKYIQYFENNEMTKSKIFDEEKSTIISAIRNITFNFEKIISLIIDLTGYNSRSIDIDRIVSIITYFSSNSNISKSNFKEITSEIYFENPKKNVQLLQILDDCNRIITFTNKRAKTDLDKVVKHDKFEKFRLILEYFDEIDSKDVNIYIQKALVREEFLDWEINDYLQKLSNPKTMNDIIYIKEAAQQIVAYYIKLYGRERGFDINDDPEAKRLNFEFEYDGEEGLENAKNILLVQNLELNYENSCKLLVDLCMKFESIDSYKEDKIDLKELSEIRKELEKYQKEIF